MLALDVHLLDGRYDAASADRLVPEWPPHPARAFCALVAGARDETDWDALRWLEQQQPPEVIAAATAEPLQRASYVVTNARNASGGSQFHPGRTNQLKRRVGVQPAKDRIRFEWPDTEVPHETYEALDRLAMRLPYLGRSTGHVIASFAVAVDEPCDGLVRYRPAEQNIAAIMLRVPFPGYLDELRENFDAGRPGSDVTARLVGYRSSRPVPAQQAAADGPYRELVVLRFPDVRPEGQLAPRFTAALRAAMLSRVPDPVPAALHGHGGDNTPHIGYLALLDAGLRETARGHLLGLALAVPAMDAGERRAVLRAFVDSEAAGHRWRLNVPGLGEYLVQYDDSSVAPRGVTPARWIGPAQSWATVTPVVFDRHPKKGDDWAELVARSCVLAGYPAPAAVQISPAPLTYGGLRLGRQDLPERLQGKLSRHMRLRFDQPVAGPLAIGAGRYLGIGLFAPEVP